MQLKSVKDIILYYKTMADKIMYIPNDDLQNYHFLRLVVETFGHSTK